MTETITRTVTVERKGLDLAERTVPVIISTETPVADQFGRTTVLVHDEDSIDLSGADRGLPLQIAHDRGALPIGRVEALKLIERTLRGVARISASERGTTVLRDIADGIITDVSVGATVRGEDWTERDGVLYAARWTPQEVSLVGKGADPGAHIQREEKAMTEMTKAPDPVVRAKAIEALFVGLEGPDWVLMERDALRSTDSVDEIRDRVFHRVKAAAVKSTHPADPAPSSVSAGRDGADKWVESVDRALTLRAGLVPPSERAAAERQVRESEHAGMSLREIARDYLRLRGANTRGDPLQVVARAMSAPALVMRESVFAHSTSDFSALLANTASKSLAAGYTENPETWRIWTRSVNMQDFKQHDFPVLSLFGDLAQVRESEEYTEGTFSDKKEVATLATYGKLFSISRQAIVNDDLNAFTEIPRRMGRAGARLVGDLVYNVLFDNAVMNEDAVALFDAATHGNFTASGTAIGVGSLNVGFTAMRTKTDPSGATLNILPTYLLVSAARENTARATIANEKDPSEGTTTAFEGMNPFFNRVQIVSDARLDGNSATAWYLAASPGMEVDTVNVGFLQGRSEPFLDQEEGFAIDGVRYKVRMDAVAWAGDWRGLYKNAGA